MKYLTLNLAFLFFSFYSIAQQNNNIEFRRVQSSAKVWLKPNTEITVYLHRYQDTITKDTVTQSYFGVLRDFDKSKSLLSMGVTTNYKLLQFANDSVKEFYVKSTFENPIQISANTINYITYTPKIRPVIEFATFVSVVTLVGLAPLMSLNIREGTFNGKTYMAVAVPAAVASIITVPLFLHVKERKVVISQ